MPNPIIEREWIGYVMGNSPNKGVGLVGAEIGTYYGENAWAIVNVMHPSSLYLVDPCNGIDSGELFIADEKTFQSVKELFSSHPFVRQVRKYSVEAAKDFTDRFFDFVYIDASHKYSDVVTDIRSWLPKVKKGGFLCGHDYVIPDVKRAVKSCGLGESCRGIHQTCTTDWIFKVV